LPQQLHVRIGLPAPCKILLMGLRVSCTLRCACIPLTLQLLLMGLRVSCMLRCACLLPLCQVLLVCQRVSCTLRCACILPTLQRLLMGLRVGNALSLSLFALPPSTIGVCRCCAAWMEGTGKQHRREENRRAQSPSRYAHAGSHVLQRNSTEC
jgi:hypothetical protein